MLRNIIVVVMSLFLLSCIAPQPTKIVEVPVATIPQVESPPPTPTVSPDTAENRTKAVKRYNAELLSYKDKIQYHIDYLSRLHGIPIPPAKPSSCSNIILGEPIIVPILPNVGGLNDAQVLDALIRHIDDLRRAVNRHNDAVNQRNSTIARLCGS